MDEVCFKYESPTCLDSCAGHNELRVSEQVIIPLSDKNPLWPESIIADVTAVELGKVTDDFSRRYTFCFDEAVLNGGPPIEECDFDGDPRCYGCCDALDERVTALEGGGGGSGTNTVTTVVQNADGDYEVIVDGVVTETIPANNVSIVSNANGTFTATDSDTGNSFTVGCVTIRADIARDVRTVTVDGFDPTTMCLREAYIDDNSVQNLVEDGVGYLGRRDGNVFTLLGTPNDDYGQAFVVTYSQF